MERLLQDLRYAARTLARNPGFTLVAVLTLGLGIGANTAIFSAIHAIVLRPLPYGDSDRLVVIRQSAPGAGRADVGVSIKEYFTYRERSRDFDSLVEYHQMSFDLLRRGEPDRVDTGVVSHNFFDVLGMRPILGRTFRADDDRPGAQAVILLSHRYWQSRFASDPGIVGQVFQMNDRPHLVIGVLPDVPHYPEENDVYMPVLACPFRAAAERQIAQNPRAFAALEVFGRLKPGVGAPAAAAGVQTISSHFTHDDPAAYRPASNFQATTVHVQEALIEQARPMLLVLLGTTALVLLLACANVANLTLARLLRRDREMALRTALGLERAGLMRLLLTESALLGLFGGLAGLVFAAATLNLLRLFLGSLTPRAEEITLDPWVLLATLVAGVITGIAFGLAPAASSTRVDLASPLKSGSKGAGDGFGHRRLQELLVVAQIAVSVVLLAGAGLLMASLLRLQRVEPGYRGAGVLSAQISGNFSKYPTVDALLRVYEPLLERLQTTPGVVSAAITTGVPLSAAQPGSVPFIIEGMANDDPDRRPTTDVRVASSRYFETLTVPVIGGRAFTDQDDREAAPVVVINQSSTRHWQGRDPIGTRISADNGATWSTVIGIVGDIRQFGLAREVPAQIYVPMKQVRFGFPGRLVIRTAGDPMQMSRTMRDAVHALDPDMPVEEIVTLDDLRRTALATPRITTTLLSLFAGLALIVTLTGIAGVLATSVAQRAREFGIRMALGETRSAILRGVLRRGLTLVGIGLVLGLIGAAGATRVLASYLFATQPADPLTLTLVAAAFIVAGLAASFGPAWRATRVDPMIALRTE